MISQQVFNPCADGVLLPELVAEVKASCTAAALAAQIEGIVEMNAIVLADGTVGNVTVTKSLDSGLDQASKTPHTHGFIDGAPWEGAFDQASAHASAIARIWSAKSS